MKIIYLSSPVRGDVSQNLELARRLVMMELSIGNAPICPHCTAITLVGLDDSSDSQRKLGQRYSSSLVRAADEVLVIETQDGALSPGCLKETRIAKKLRMPIIQRPRPKFLMVPFEFTWRDTVFCNAIYLQWRGGLWAG